MYLSQTKSSFCLYNSEQMPESVNSLSHLPNIWENKKMRRYTNVHYKNMFIYLIYLGLLILGRVIPTAYGANYCRPEHSVPP